MNLDPAAESGIVDDQRHPFVRACGQGDGGAVDQVVAAGWYHRPNLALERRAVVADGDGQRYRRPGFVYFVVTGLRTQRYTAALHESEMREGQ